MNELLEHPWATEPDSEDWLDDETGLACAIRRNGSGALCGYVEVKPGHPLFQKEYSDYVEVPEELIKREVSMDKIGIIPMLCADKDSIDQGRLSPELAIDVHGGITYSRAKAPYNDESEDSWWFGFDCSHAGDLSPKYGGAADDIYRDIEYVRAECRSMAKQLKALAA